VAEEAHEAPGDRLQDPGDDQDDDDATAARQREGRLVVQAVQIRKEVFN
jgi:hypothetical protein